ncbi:DUF6338 family protein [Cellulomonas sp. PSBB021]|uniref:DUF6338 family protein n=1 Tax=Cellulomonas sp. PSBB021 TaxID=2003551 RepID=UPI0035160418
MTQVMVLVLVALPGITYATVRNRARGLGASTISATLKVGEGLAAGVVFDLVYLAVFGAALIEAFTLADGRLPSVRAAATYALVLGAVVPALVAWIAHRGSRWTRPTSGALRWAIRRARPLRRAAAGWWTANVGRVVPAFSRIPTAWDAAAPNLGRRFVRIETASGKFVGGWFGENSFVSTYPEPHDLYVEQQWRMSETGEFLGAVPGSDGFWYALQPGDIIDWVDPDNAAAESATAPSTGGATRGD